MAEIEFEENCAEIKDYLQTVRACMRELTQIPKALQKLLGLLDTSSALLADLCTFDGAPEDLQQQCVWSRQQLLQCRDGDPLQRLTASIQHVVHERLQRMEVLSQQSYTACKARRVARAKYLSDTASKGGPFNIAATTAEKTQRHKEEYTTCDTHYRAMCREFAHYRFDEMGVAQRDFYSGYAGVFALLTNGLNLPSGSVDPSTTAANTRQRLRGRNHTDSEPATKDAEMASSMLRLLDGSAVDKGAAATQSVRALSAEESYRYQRRLSARAAAEADGPSAMSRPDDAIPTAWPRTESTVSGEMLAGIPVTNVASFAQRARSYTTRPPAAATVATAPDEDLSSWPDSMHNARSSSSSSSSSRSSTPVASNAVSPDRPTIGTPSRESTGAAPRLSGRATDDGEPRLRQEYSLFNSFDAW